LHRSKVLLYYQQVFRDREIYVNVKIMTTNEKTLEALKQSENTTVMDNKAQIANAWASQNVAESIQNLHRQFPITISELRETITRNTDKIIESNTSLSKSNKANAKALNWLTGALVVVTILSIFIN